MNDKARKEFNNWWENEAPMAIDYDDVWIAAKERYEPRWISCGDRLPEDGDYGVLAFWDNGGMDMVHVQDYFRDITSGLDAEGNQLYTKWYLSAGVTHWMPLPTAPRTQGGGE